MVKLVVIDLDGTLLETHQHVSKNNKKILKAVLAKGVPVAICTGRNFHMTDRIIKQLKLPVYYACVGGTEIYSPNHELIHSTNLSTSDIKSAIEIIKHYPCMLQITKRDGYYKLLTDPSAKKYELFGSKSIKDRFKSWFTRMTYVKHVEDFYDHRFNDSNEIVVGGEHHILEEIKALIENSDLALSCRMDLWPNYLFVSKVHQSKADACKYLASYFDVKMNEVLALGDDYNDVDMIEAVGYGIAMENALEQVKKVSDDITKSNKEDGVAYALNHYVIEERQDKIAG